MGSLFTRRPRWYRWRGHHRRDPDCARRTVRPCRSCPRHDAAATGFIGDIENPHRLCADWRAGRRLIPPNRRPDPIPGRRQHEPGAPAGVDIEGRRSIADLLADRSAAPRRARPRSPASTPICSRAVRCCLTPATSSPTASAPIDQPGDGAVKRHPRQLNVPPLEPVPSDHVLTKSFFILPEFPGRFSGSPLWVEACSTPATENRPVRATASRRS